MDLVCELTGKIQRKFHQPFLFTTLSLFSQGAGRKACSHSPSGFFWSFLSLSWQAFGAFKCCMWTEEALSHLEFLGRLVVNPGMVCTALPYRAQGLWGHFLQSHSSQGAWGFMLPLAWPKYCSHSHPQQKILSEGGKHGVSSKCYEHSVIRHQTETGLPKLSSWQVILDLWASKWALLISVFSVLLHFLHDEVCEPLCPEPWTAIALPLSEG